MAEKDEIAQLLSKVALKDENAFRVLYDRTSAKLFGICLRILKDRNEAEAVLQQVYITIWNKAGLYARGKARGMTWLAAIARNASIDVLRRTRPVAADIDDLPNLASADPSPESASMAQSEKAAIDRCLDELDQTHAKMVRHIYLEGWTYQQAADLAKVPLNTMKTWIRRSLLALRDCLSR